MTMYQPLQYQNEVRALSAMKFMSIRELQKSTIKIKNALSNDGKIVITTAGKPTALMIPISEENFEETLTLLKQARFAKAVQAMQQSAARNGLEDMTMDDIDAEVAQYRKEKRVAESQGANP